MYDTLDVGHLPYDISSSLTIQQSGLTSLGNQALAIKPGRMTVLLSPKNIPMSTPPLAFLALVYTAPSCCRLMADESAESEQAAAAFNVVEVPTFIFLRNGKEVARHVGSSRGDLIGKILQVSLREPL